MRLKIGITRIDALRRERQQEIFVNFKPVSSSIGNKNFVSRAGISGRFQNDQLTAAQTLLDSVPRPRE